MNGPGPIALLGGCEHMAQSSVIDRSLLDSVGASKPRVSVIPLAASLRSRPRVAALARNHWNRLGVEVSFCGLPDQSVLEGRETIDSADVIVLPGGHPNKLMAGLALSPLFDDIVRRWDRGAGLAGSSAGAMCLFEWQLRLYPPNPLSLVPGLGMLDGYVAAPHFDRLRAQHWASWAARWVPQAILGLDESTGLVGRLDDLRVVGAGSVSVIEAGLMSRYPHGAQVGLDLLRSFRRGTPVRTTDLALVAPLPERSVAPESDT